jgi:hypothetical protein
VRSVWRSQPWDRFLGSAPVEFAYELVDVGGEFVGFVDVVTVDPPARGHVPDAFRQWAVALTRAVWTAPPARVERRHGSLAPGVGRSHFVLRSATAGSYAGERYEPVTGELRTGRRSWYAKAHRKEGRHLLPRPDRVTRFASGHLPAFGRCHLTTQLPLHSSGEGGRFAADHSPLASPLPRHRSAAGRRTSQGRPGTTRTLIDTGDAGRVLGGTAQHATGSSRTSRTGVRSSIGAR